MFLCVCLFLFSPFLFPFRFLLYFVDFAYLEHVAAQAVVLVAEAVNLLVIVVVKEAVNYFNHLLMVLNLDYLDCEPTDVNVEIMHQKVDVVIVNYVVDVGVDGVVIIHP